jgi:hypothetical protein
MTRDDGLPICNQVCFSGEQSTKWSALSFACKSAYFFIKFLPQSGSRTSTRRFQWDLQRNPAAHVLVILLGELGTSVPYELNHTLEKG